ncbi:hypothetical protein [Agrococcus casei]|uniref:hypothetical protein n=1 Tax=Agrococcus casei TaxID=343512 RepID=UPI003F9067B0
MRMRKRFRSLVVATSAVLLSVSLVACGPEYWPSSEEEPSASPGASPSPSTLEETLPKPSITVSQFERVLEETRATIAQADEERDTSVLEARVGGSVLETRGANYEALAEDDSVEPASGIPDGEVQLVLPQQNESWPRHVLAVVGWQDESQVPQALIFEQVSARSDFKLVYQVYLQVGIQLPELAASQVGAPVIAGDSSLTMLPPSQVPGAYADIMTTGEKADHYGAFAAEPDELREGLGYEHKQKNYVDNKDFELIDFEFSNDRGSSPVISFSTKDGGALVAGSFTESTEFELTEDGVSVTLSDSRSGMRALLGGEEKIESDIRRVDEYQVLVYVPPAPRDGEEPGQIEMLGYNAAIVKAEEIG